MAPLRLPPQKNASTREKHASGFYKEVIDCLDAEGITLDDVDLIVRNCYILPEAEMKDILNSRVKHRQAFRPFAPIVLAERAKEVFEGEEDSPFMLIAKRVRPEWQDKIPAVVHVDGTARVQTVREETNPVLYRLLKEFEALTGVPVLINTSFNVKGEPIVETPRDAVVCFPTTGIDNLVLHDTMVSKNALHKIVGPLVGVYTDVASMVMANIRPA